MTIGHVKVNIVIVRSYISCTFVRPRNKLLVSEGIMLCDKWLQSCTINDSQHNI